MTTRTSMCSASSSAGGRVCGVIRRRRESAHRERLADQRPPRRRVPCGVEDVGPGLVDPRSGNVDPKRTQPEGACRAIEQGAEDAGRVEARHTEPVDRAVGGDQCAGVAVREKGVVRDRREGRGRGGALLRRRFGRALRLGWALCLAGLMPVTRVRASRRFRRPACPPLSVPRSRACTDGPWKASPAGGRGSARSPRCCPGG